MTALRRLKPVFWEISGLTTLLVCVIIGAPVAAALIAGVFAGGGDIWSHIVSTRLGAYAGGTLSVIALTAVFILLIAVPAAWFVSLWKFPGRGFFEWALILPLATPGYVLSYAWADLTAVSGPLQSMLRDLTGLSARDYWFPELYNEPGLAFVMACALFPYVYLTARAAFTTQSLCTLEAARALGTSSFGLFWRVALPAARPAIFAGLILALMETAADFGAADYLGVQTLSVGVVRAWYSFGEPATAARLAVMLIFIAFALQALEKLSRGRAGTQQTATRWRTVARKSMDRRKALAVTALCTLILLFSFILPVARLVWMAVETGIGNAPILRPLLNSLALASAGAALAFIAALAVSIGARRNATLQRIARFVASAGYAAPGVVLALGGLFVLSGLSISIAGPLALVLLVWIYASRFTAAGAEPLDAAFARAPASLDHAASSLGAGRLTRLIRVDLPIALSGAAAAGIILFVETLKELPATLMLRPFNWDTLAVQAHAYASDERLAAATIPSLLITLAGLAPVILLSNRLSEAGRARMVEAS